MERSSMLYPATIIFMLHALWNGLRWMQHVLSANSIFSREMTRYEWRKQKDWTQNDVYVPKLICMYRRNRGGRIERSFSKLFLRMSYHMWLATFMFYCPLGVCLFIMPMCESFQAPVQNWSNWSADFQFTVFFFSFGGFLVSLYCSYPQDKKNNGLCISAFVSIKLF